MQIIVSKVDILKDKTYMEVVHKDYSVSFVGKAFQRKYFDEYDQFSILNRYLNTLPEEIHDQCFKYYVEAKRCMEDIWNKNELINNLEIIVYNIYELFNFDNFRSWVSLNVSLPELESNFAATYSIQMDDVGSRDQTYLRSEYIDLITLAAILRFMLPIWNEFIDRTKNEYGSSFKEYYAFRLLRRSWVYVCPAMEKLRVYISYPLKANFDSSSTILSGVSTEDIPTLMLALVVIRRLIIGRLENNEPNVHLITFIYKYVFRKAQSSKSSGKNVIKEKIIRKNEDDDEKESSLDRYKIKFQISGGDVAELEFAIKNYEYLIKRYCPNIDRNIIRENMESVQALLPVKLEDAQIVLLSWVFDALVPSRGLMYVNKETILIAMAVAQSILREIGFPFLAMLLTAFPDKSSKEFMATSAETKARIPKELIDQLDYIFPFVKRTGRRGNVKLVNPAMTLINNININFNSINWYFTAKDKYIYELYGENSTRQIIIPGDLKLQLTQCLINLINLQVTDTSI